jgi:hypothetical protein
MHAPTASDSYPQPNGLAAPNSSRDPRFPNRRRAHFGLAPQALQPLPTHGEPRQIELRGLGGVEFSEMEDRYSIDEPKQGFAEGHWVMSS